MTIGHADGCLCDVVLNNAGSMTLSLITVLCPCGEPGPTSLISVAVVTVFVDFFPLGFGFQHAAVLAATWDTLVPVALWIASYITFLPFGLGLGHGHCGVSSTLGRDSSLWGSAPLTSTTGTPVQSVALDFFVAPFLF